MVLVRSTAENGTSQPSLSDDRGTQSAHLTDAIGTKPNTLLP